METRIRRVGVVFRPYADLTESLARKLGQALKDFQTEAWVCSAWEEKEVRSQAKGTDLVLCVGGDGTILRAARQVAPWAVPLFGVNLGRVGFMAEVAPEEVFDVLPRLLAGEGWVEERAMLQAELCANKNAPLEGSFWHALNDVVVARGAHCRLIRLEAAVDGEPLASYRADAIIVATATGSTAYSLSAGGPILYPEAKDMVVTPLASHLSMARSVVVPPTSLVEIRVHSDLGALLSVDGQIDTPLDDGATIRVTQSPQTARFLRLRPRTYFYKTVAEKVR